MKRFLDWFRKDTTPRLKNKPGGMSWIKPHGQSYGAEALAGRAVRTVAVDARGYWLIEPEQKYVVTGSQAVAFEASGVTVQPGTTVVVSGLRDDLLQPWKDDGITDSEVRDLYAPRLTNKETA